jgi:hypothetical protein
VQAVVATRNARSAVFGLDLANPGRSLLLELFRAQLEKRPGRLARLATDARVAATTATRWLETFGEAGFVRREADPERQGGVLLVLSSHRSGGVHAGVAALGNAARTNHFPTPSFCAID